MPICSRGLQSDRQSFASLVRCAIRAYMKHFRVTINQVFLLLIPDGKLHQSSRNAPRNSDFVPAKLKSWQGNQLGEVLPSEYFWGWWHLDPDQHVQMVVYQTLVYLCFPISRTLGMCRSAQHQGSKPCTMKTDFKAPMPAKRPAAVGCCVKRSMWSFWEGIWLWMSKGIFEVFYLSIC